MSVNEEGKIPIREMKPGTCFYYESFRRNRLYMVINPAEVEETARLVDIVTGQIDGIHPGQKFEPLRPKFFVSIPKEQDLLRIDVDDSIGHDLFVSRGGKAALFSRIKPGEVFRNMVGTIYMKIHGTYDWWTGPGLVPNVICLSNLDFGHFSSETPVYTMCCEATARPAIIR